MWMYNTKVIFSIRLYSCIIHYILNNKFIIYLLFFIVLVGCKRRLISPHHTHHLFISIKTCFISFIKRKKCYHPLTNSPMICGLLVKAMVGIVANGSCKLMTAFNTSFIPLKSVILLKNATKNVGIIATALVNNTLFHRFQDKFKNPWKKSHLLLFDTKVRWM